MKQMNLQAKLFLAYLSLASLVLFFFAVFFYFFVSRQLLDSQIQAMDTLNASFLEQVDSSIRDLDIVSANINYSSMSKNVLNQTFDLNITDDMLNNMADLFISISGTELKSDQINLYDFSGNVLQAGLSTMIKSASEEQMALAREAVQLGGSKIVTAPYETDVYTKPNKYQQWFVSLYRSFNNQYGRPVGAIETVKKAKSIFKSIISYEKKNKNETPQICIFSRDGELIYPYNIEQEEREILCRYFNTVTEKNAGAVFESPGDGTREYASVDISKYTGYTYMTIQKESQILAPVYQLLRILLLVTAILLLAAGVFSYRFSRSLVKPIKHLKHIIQRMELDTLGKEKATGYPTSVNELEELYQAFQNMSTKLQSSMAQLIEAQEQELKSRSLALQSQMNPHFYYNSLSNIIVLAENNDTDEVIKMCRNLSGIMRYITNGESTAVTLKKELEHVQQYLYCMKVRYQSSLNYVIDVDHRLLTQEIPKLIIQPLVENALKYGTKGAPPWNISVKGYVTGDSWQIDVIDSGEGFSEEALDLITRRMEEAEKNPGMPELKINGLGLLNVYLRWKLFCKEKIIFKAGNTAEGHGIVSIGQYHNFSESQ